MMRPLVSYLVAVVALVALPEGASAARASRFDPATVTTVTGEVKEVRRIPNRRSEGVHLDLTTGEGVIDVHLGPATFLDRQSVKLEPGDRIEVTGSRVGKSRIIAQAVKKGDVTLTLRDARGISVWARTRY